MTVELENPERLPESRTRGERGWPFGIVGESPEISEAVRMIRIFGPSTCHILIVGDTGTGKELVAQGIHEASERNGRFLPVNVAAISPELLASELFGHVRGAFTGADDDRPGAFVAAGGGTLFLDEIGEAPLSVQVSLLRVLDTGQVKPVGSDEPVDARVVAATNRDLGDATEEGTFREDLFARLEACPIRLPPLCERGADLELLIDWFLEGHGCTPEARACLGSYRLPHNVRELEGELDRARALAGEEPIRVEHLSARVLRSGPVGVEHREGSSGTEAWKSLSDVEREHILLTMEAFEATRTREQIAAMLGISPNTLRGRLLAYGWGEDEGGEDRPGAPG